MATKTYRKGAPGIVEVANRAGVSPATVSRFFNHPRVVRGSTRIRIEKAAAELGYIRDRMAGAMHSRFSGTIGVIVPTINNAIFAEMIDAFSSSLLQHDRTTLLASHNYDLSMEVSIVRSLLERRIDGVVLVGKDHDTNALDMLNLRQVPIVSVWNYHQSDSMSCVGSDNFDAAGSITRHLLELGHRDIALMFPETGDNDRARDRFQGAQASLENANVQLPNHRIAHCPYDIPEAKRMAIRLLTGKRAPTAIMCGNDIIAQGVIYACQQLGLSIPADVSIAGIGDFAGSSEIEPSLTTVRLPARRMGIRAAELIIKHIEDASLKVEHVKIDAMLKVRNSTAAPRKSSRLKSAATANRKKEPS